MLRKGERVSRQSIEREREREYREREREREYREREREREYRESIERERVSREREREREREPQYIKHEHQRTPFNGTSIVVSNLLRVFYGRESGVFAISFFLSCLLAFVLHVFSRVFE